MSLLELTPDARELANEIFFSYDGQTTEQRRQAEFFKEVVEPRLVWIEKLAVWDALEPHIVRGTE